MTDFEMNLLTADQIRNQTLFHLFQISDAFRKFGMADSDRSVLVCEIHRAGESQMKIVQESVKGTLVDIEKLSEMANEAQIKKVRSAFCQNVSKKTKTFCLKS